MPGDWSVLTERLPVSNPSELTASIFGARYKKRDGERRAEGQSKNSVDFAMISLSLILGVPLARDQPFYPIQNRNSRLVSPNRYQILQVSFFIFSPFSWPLAPEEDCLF